MSRRENKENTKFFDWFSVLHIFFIMFFTLKVAYSLPSNSRRRRRESGSRRYSLSGHVYYIILSVNYIFINVFRKRATGCWWNIRTPHLYDYDEISCESGPITAFYRTAKLSRISFTQCRHNTRKNKRIPRRRPQQKPMPHTNHDWMILTS